MERKIHWYFLCSVLVLILAGLVSRMIAQWLQSEPQKVRSRVQRSSESCPQTWPLAQRKPWQPWRRRMSPPWGKKTRRHSRLTPAPKKHLPKKHLPPIRQNNPSEWCSNDNDSSSTTSTTTNPIPMSNIPPNKINWSPSNWKNTGKLLGSGSHGHVYEGIRHDNALTFAVKQASSEQGRYYLKQEILLLSQLKHENIVQYYGAYEDESNLYMFLELATKGSLSNVYKNYPLGDSQVSCYTKQVLHGLKYLHDQNVFHGDIKCANILVHATGSVKLADFGMAEVIHLNDVKSFNGTPLYRAPEVYSRKNHGLPADIWSTGCAVLEMLTRNLPYFDCDQGKISNKIKSGQPPTVPEYLSKDARNFILQCLKAEENDRPTAAELLEHPFVKKPLGSTSPHFSRRS